MATYARLVKGFNAARTFKLVMPSVKNGLTVRKPRTEESVAMLSAVVGAKTLDAVSNEQTEARLAAIQRGDMATTRPRPTRKPGPAEAR